MGGGQKDSEKNNPDLRFLFSHPANFAGLGLGSGLAPKAPGTFGTLAAIPLWLLLADCTLLIQIAVVALAFVLGIYLCGKTAADLGEHDHGAIVWDEFVGFWLTMLFAPSGWLWVAVGFVLFRIFDILKPWPIRYFDKHVHGGFGIMLDDIIAALFAGALIRVLTYLV